MTRARVNALLLVICNLPDICVSSCKMVCQFVSKANEMVHGRGTVDAIRCDEKAGLRRDAVGSPVIDALAAGRDPGMPKAL
jgi:hypothetical protein